MQRLDPTVHDLGEVGVTRNVLHRDAGSFDRFAGSTGGNNFETQLDEPLNEAIDAGFIADADECSSGKLFAHDNLKVSRIPENHQNGGACEFSQIDQSFSSSLDRSRTQPQPSYWS